MEANQIIFKRSPIHGIGAYAQCRLAKGTRVIEYVGELISAQESIERCRQGNEYIFRLSAERHLDGKVDWNAARFVNHSCAPNCEAQLIEGRIWLVAARDIEAGEEITFDYGYDLEDFHQHPCHCGSADCVGYIVATELRDSVRAANAPWRRGAAGGSDS